MVGLPYTGLVKGLFLIIFIISFIIYFIRGLFEVVKLLVGEGAELNIKTTKSRWTPVQRAANEGSLEIVQWLAEQGASLRDVDKNGNSILHLTASGSDNAEVMQWLIEESGSSFSSHLNSLDGMGKTVLRRAVDQNHVKIATYLIHNHNIRVDAVGEDGWTPLHWAAGNGQFEIVEFLVNERGADVTALDDQGWTPIFRAAGQGYQDIVQFLLETGRLDATQVDNSGWTILHWAAEAGHDHVVTYLLGLGNEDVNVVAGDDWTPVHLAARNGLKDLALSIACSMNCKLRLLPSEYLWGLFTLFADHGSQEEDIAGLLRVIQAAPNLLSDAGEKGRRKLESLHEEFRNQFPLMMKSREFRPVEVPAVRIHFIGDSNVGKTSLLRTFAAHHWINPDNPESLPSKSRGFRLRGRGNTRVTDHTCLLFVLLFSHFPFFYLSYVFFLYSGNSAYFLYPTNRCK